MWFCGILRFLAKALLYLALGALIYQAVDWLAFGNRNVLPVAEIWVWLGMAPPVLKVFGAESAFRWLEDQPLAPTLLLLGLGLLGLAAICRRLHRGPYGAHRG